MLPNSPRTMPGGLPSGPRSRSTGPSRRQNARRSDSPIESTNFPPSTRHLRSQRSLASISREPSRAGPPLPSPPTSSEYSRSWQRKYTPQSPQSSSSYDSTSSRISQDSSSTASSASSMFDRVKNGAASYASSFTSIEDHDNEVDSDSRGRSMRKPHLLPPVSAPLPERVEMERTDTGTGDGYTVWNRVATAASTLTISVSKAWAANVSVLSGEETPPGQESRLTRAMKAYHIEKARDSSELPAFLFAEHERQPRKRPPRVEEQQVAPHNVRSGRGREEGSGVRNRKVPESASTLDRSINRSTALNNNMELSKQSQTGTDRLKALREARRTQTTTASDFHVTTEQAAPQLPRPRVGLPSTPGPRRR
ncbi:hypothetical protein EV359DRAFT_82143 [Lentinula novae-zelandiae]|nr:hypothetical protein EV359DRAFT_82143 [Lentinula novae-zelandiae]